MKGSECRSGALLPDSLARYPYCEEIRMRSLIAAFLVVTCIWLSPATSRLAQGQCLEADKISASDGGFEHGFGQAVALSGDVAVVGAPGALAKAAYVFRHDGSSWTQEQKLTISGASSNPGTGKAVAVDGDAVLVGAWSDSSGSGLGSAAVFRFDGSAWIQEQKLTASNASTFLFGQSAALHGNVALIGAEDNNGRGAVYAFRFDGTAWNEEQVVVPADAANNKQFGWSVALDGEDTALVGAVGYGGGDDSAYVFRHDGSSWIQEQKLLPSDLSIFNFGSAVALSGDLAAVGAWNDGAGPGYAYVFRYDGSSWIEEQELQSPNPVVLDFYGSSIAVQDNALVVGANELPGASAGGVDGPGAAYLYRLDGTSWILERTLLASDGEDYDGLGVSAAMDGDTLLVGANEQGDQSDFDPLPGNGAAYFFEIGDGLELTASPTTVMSGDPLTFTTRHGVPGRLGALFVTAVNESPMFLQAGTGPFDSTCTFAFSGTVPVEPNLPGSTIRFLVLTIGPSGFLISSNEAEVVFQ
jgi:hypothetical protein